MIYIWHLLCYYNLVGTDLYMNIQLNIQYLIISEFVKMMIGRFYFIVCFLVWQVLSFRDPGQDMMECVDSGEDLDECAKQ